MFNSDLRHGLLCALLLPSMSAVASGTIPTPPPAPPAALVRELLELDAQRALADEQAKTRRPAAFVPSGASSASAPRDETVATAAGAPMDAAVLLRGIYGIEPFLQAELTIAGSRVMFRAGHAQPIAGESGGFRLVRIAAPCVDLADAAGKALRRCAWSARP